MKKFVLSAAIAATLVSSFAFAESAFDGIPSEAVQAKELDAVSGQGYYGVYQGQVVYASSLAQMQNLYGKNVKSITTTAPSTWGKSSTKTTAQPLPAVNSKTPAKVPAASTPKPVTPLTTTKVPSYVGTSTPARINNAFGSAAESNAIRNASKNNGNLTKVGNNYVTTNSLSSKQPMVVYTKR